ncbi:MAG: 50S ribosome-binding GTPase, partial [Candidatus Woesearchaeota archaeon]|nr:50S ribosome-binding GTPase [Candidatus Woesearchaeota archaeon]
MAFQDIITIESPQFYIDFAFKAAKKRTDLMRSKKLTGDKLNIIRQIYLIKIETVESKLVGKLDQILQSFPRLDDLDDFYKELVKVTMDYPEVKKSLGGVNWAITKIKSFSRGYKAKIKQCQHYTKTVEYQKQYFGRISSVIKQIKDELHLLEDARKVLKHFPTIKTSLPTVAIVGFPNIGKTTLLYKLTGSKPEIDSYAFTTKSINTAYLIKDKKKIQFMDTPGTLNRFNKMNNIEKQAYLALEFLTHHI